MRLNLVLAALLFVGLAPATVEASCASDCSARHRETAAISACVKRCKAGDTSDTRSDREIAISNCTSMMATPQGGRRSDSQAACEKAAGPAKQAAPPAAPK